MGISTALTLKEVVADNMKSNVAKIGKLTSKSFLLKDTKRITVLTDKKMAKDYQICSHCLMDTSDPTIRFDKDGVCNHCRNWKKRAERELRPNDCLKLVDTITLAGQGKPYDCVIGLSGGLDSSYMAYVAKKFGLRPLFITIHSDFDTEIAKHNSSRILLEYGIQSAGYNWKAGWLNGKLRPEIYTDLQVSFLKASVINAEIPTDHGIIGVLYEMAAKAGVKYILHGGNLVTEGIMPESWSYSAQDWRHINAIHKRFGTIPLKGFPHMTLFHWFYYVFIKRIKWVPLLNYVKYDPFRAKQILTEELGWQDYGEKHCESIYTRFYQKYILPKKFGIDKRQAFFSSLICAGLMEREEAISRLRSDSYNWAPDKNQILSKLGMGQYEFEDIMRKPPVAHTEYPNNRFWFEGLRGIARRVAT